MAVDGAVLNVLRWSVSGRDAHGRIPPDKLQPVPAFGAQRPPAVTRADFRTSGFTHAHLDGVRFHGYRVTSGLVVEATRLLRAGEPFVYAYYEGIDKVAHEYGLADHFDAEVAYVDRLVGDLAASLPPGAALVVTCDHGQVEVGDHIVALDRDVFDQLSFQSGEGRFRWSHARPGRAEDLAEATEAHHGHQRWVDRPRPVHRRRLAGSRGHRRGPRAAGRRGAGGQGQDSPSSTATTAGPSSWSVDTDRSPRPDAGAPAGPLRLSAAGLQRRRPPS